MIIIWVESPKWKEFQRCEIASNQNKFWLKKIDITLVFSPLGYGVIIEFN